MIRTSIAVLAVLAGIAGASPAAETKGVSPHQAAVHLSGKIGSRPSTSRNERRAHAYVASRFRSAGLDVSVNPFHVPGRGESRNVVGKLDTPASCLRILMAHADSVPPGHGAIDNASGVGVLVALAPKLSGLHPDCDVWLVATGSEERTVTGLPYHAGAAALVKQVKAEGRASDLRFALALDEVGFGKRFYLRSPQPAIRAGVEGEILAAAHRAGVTVHWARDSGTGNSDHREFELAGLPGANLEIWRGDFPCHHMACDRPRLLQKGALNRALRIAEEVAKFS
ncbi:MAG TPA: M28 family peptidase [Solirubrobacterales bacterium]|nr:M28 family peptidase [Solirubrobacterales bacterium]